MTARIEILPAKRRHGRGPNMPRLELHIDGQVVADARKLHNRDIWIIRVDGAPGDEWITGEQGARGCLQAIGDKHTASVTS